MTDWAMQSGLCRGDCNGEGSRRSLLFRPWYPQTSSGQGQKSDSLPFGKPGPYSISCTQVSLRSQAKPDPRVEPVGVTTPSTQTGLLVPQEHGPYGWGLLSTLPDLKSRSLGITGVGIGPQDYGEHDIAKEADPLLSRLDNTLGRREPGTS